MNWIDVNDEMPLESDIYVLACSPCYEEIRTNHEMTFRIMNGQFVGICTEVTHWARLVAP